MKNTNKLIACLLCVAVLFSLTACGNEKTTAVHQGAATGKGEGDMTAGEILANFFPKTEEEDPTPAVNPEPEPEPEPLPAPDNSPEGTPDFNKKTDEPEPEPEPAPIAVSAGELSAEEVYKKVSPAVVELHVFDAQGNYFSLGSGFFIDNAGTIATNYHVIEGGSAVEAYTADGEAHSILRVLAWSEELDLALLECEYHNTAYLERGGEARTGERIYALGSSQGLTGTFSEGIVSTASRTVDGKNCIQITAPISKGNSGGPLVDGYGKVLGINSMVYLEGQNLNFAIKIAELDKLVRDQAVQMADFSGNGVDTTPQYDEPGMAVYDMADYIEGESNDELNDADMLVSGTSIAGALDIDNDDLDLYAIYLEKGQMLTIRYINYYTEDDDYAKPFLCTLDLDILQRGVFDDDDESYYLQITAEEDGYIVVAVYCQAESYPYDSVAYYIMYTLVS